MAFDKRSALSHIPEFYLDEKIQSDIIVNDSGKYENAELLNPNSVNLSANIIDHINSQQGGFNTWSSMEDYIQEFRLEELFTDEKFYSVKQPELLKGFFKFKGTTTDIKYIMKVAGYELVIYEPSSHYGDSYELVNNVVTYQVDNSDPYKIAGNRDWNCQLSSKLYVDLDRPDFDGFRSREVIKRIRGLIDARIALCVYLSAIELNLVTRTFFHIREKLDDSTLQDLTRETYSDLKDLANTNSLGQTVLDNAHPRKADGSIVRGTENFTPAYDYMFSDLDRQIEDKHNFINEPTYNKKVYNINPRRVQAQLEDDTKSVTVQGQVESSPYERGYDYRLNNANPIEVDNQDPVVTEGRLAQLGDNYIREGDTEIAVAIGGNRCYRVHNTNPLKIRNSKPERQVIEDNTFDVILSKTTVDIHRRAKKLNDKVNTHIGRDAEDYLSNNKIIVRNSSPLTVNNNSPLNIYGRFHLDYMADDTSMNLDKELFDTYYMSEQNFGYVLDNSGAKVVNIHWKKQIRVQGSLPKTIFPKGEIALDNIDGWELSNEDGFILAGQSIEELKELFPESDYVIEYTPKTIILSVLDNEFTYNVNNIGGLKVRGRQTTQIDDYAINMEVDRSLQSDEFDIHINTAVVRVDGSHKAINHNPEEVAGTYIQAVYSYNDNLLTSYSEDFIGGDLDLVNNVGGLKVTNDTKVKGQSAKMEYLSESELLIERQNRADDTYYMAHRNHSKTVFNAKVVNNPDFIETVQGYQETIYPLVKSTRIGAVALKVNNITPLDVVGRLIQFGETFAYNDRTSIYLIVDNSKGYKVNNLGKLKARGINSLMLEDFNTELDFNREFKDETSKPTDYSLIGLEDDSIDSLGATVSIDNTRALKVNNESSSKVKGKSELIEYLNDDLELTVEKDMKSPLQFKFKDYSYLVDGTKVNNEFTHKIRGYEPTVYPLDKIYRVDEEQIIVNNEQPIGILGRLVKSLEVYEYTDNTVIPVATDNLASLDVDNRRPMKTAGIIRGHRHLEELMVTEADMEFTPYFRLRIGGKEVLDTKRAYIGNAKVINDSTEINLLAVV